MSQALLTFGVASSSALLVTALLAAAWMVMDMGRYEDNFMNGLSSFKDESGVLWDQMMSKDNQRFAREARRHKTNRKHRQQAAQTQYAESPVGAGANGFGGDECSCPTTSCPAGPPGPPGANGMPGGKDYGMF
ncbi:unnamed protein product [Cylicostephanus goldi]|uniref:Nematode cuticle collagen N-terminal domain-containing protein n=1 Tax=Cylicostephanus goldi TaxID=71465 RepID=A0A3P7N902_CYLGO|nr:unnamed protein product [Cylicostephanus goldi]